jgi:hypothetical protein
MRVWFAGLFCFGGILTCVGVYGHCFPSGLRPPWLIQTATIIVFFGFIGISLFLFNKKNDRPFECDNDINNQIELLERQGLLTLTTFQATRAFAVEEFEHEGSHYFLELADKSILYLSGQYLWDFEEITDDPELNQPRLFPCTEFSVRRHKEEGYVVGLICMGRVLTPECTVPSFDRSDEKGGLIPIDGQIYTDRTYEQLKRDCIKGRT